MSIHHGPPCVICGRPTFGRTRAEAASRIACGLSCASKAKARALKARGLRICQRDPDANDPREERDLYADRWAARSRELIAQGVDRDRAHVLAARELMGASHG